MAPVRASRSGAPGAIGPYSQAVKTGNMVFCSGQIPIDPATGEFVSNDVAEQTEQTVKLLRDEKAKRTAELIPLCHPLPLTDVRVSLRADANIPGVRCESTVRTIAVTGVVVFYRAFLVATFDETLAALLGLRPRLANAALLTLVSQLRETDTLSLVVFDSEARLPLDSQLVRGAGETIVIMDDQSWPDYFVSASVH